MPVVAAAALAVQLCRCTPDAAHRTPRLRDGAVLVAGDATGAGGGAGAPSGGGAPPGVVCGEVEPWVPGGPYKEGMRVTHGSPAHVYECKPWPFSGWCPN